MQLNLWWTIVYKGLYFGIIMSMAYTLYRNGLRYFRDIWDLGKYKFLKWEDTKVKLSLEEVHQNLWLKLIDLYGPFRDRMLNQ